MPLHTCVFVAGFALVGLPATAQSRDHADAERRTSDAVSASVRDAPQLTVFDVVHASVHDGVVTLTGKVTEPGKRDAVRDSVERIEGVGGVQNLIEVLPPSESDAVLREKVARAVYGHARFWGYAMMTSPPVRIIVEGGHMTLTGLVRHPGDRTLARALAMQAGASTVSNEIEIR